MGSHFAVVLAGNRIGRALGALFEHFGLLPQD